jgi:hypothetical protein
VGRIELFGKNRDLKKKYIIVKKIKFQKEVVVHFLDPPFNMVREPMLVC